MLEGRIREDGSEASFVTRFTVMRLSVPLLAYATADMLSAPACRSTVYGALGDAFALLVAAS